MRGIECQQCDTLGASTFAYKPIKRALIRNRFHGQLLQRKLIC